MGCKECSWMKINDYIFPDCTKTIECSRYKKHLGFTDENWNVKSVSSVEICEFNRHKIVNNVNENIINCKIEFDEKLNMWNLIELADKEVVIAIRENKCEIEYLFEKFNNKKSLGQGITWNKKMGKYQVYIWNKEIKKRKHICYCKYYYDAQQRLDAINNCNWTVR